jgi:uncharacterized protein with GYD domain
LNKYDVDYRTVKRWTRRFEAGNRYLTPRGRAGQTTYCNVILQQVHCAFLTRLVNERPEQQHRINTSKEAVGVEMLDLLFTLETPDLLALETPDLLAGTKHGRNICQNPLTPAFSKTYNLCFELITWG